MTIKLISIDDSEIENSKNLGTQEIVSRVTLDLKTAVSRLPGIISVEVNDDVFFSGCNKFLARVLVEAGSDLTLAILGRIVCGKYSEFASCGWHIRLGHSSRFPVNSYDIYIGDSKFDEEVNNVRDFSLTVNRWVDHGPISWSRFFADTNQ